ncbi:membrane protein [marine actinobacterium PHSC20C1]|nr:membrane protein [marine actinobacterium PHSC20C1]
MALGPRLSDFPRIRRTLTFYKVSSVITGSFLLILCLMMFLRYGLGGDIELNGPYGFLALQNKELITGINVSTIILIVHGWLYVFYVAADFVLWRLTRFSFLRFLYIALGGVIPLLSFFLERQVPRFVNAKLARIESAAAATAASANSAKASA